MIAPVLAHDHAGFGEADALLLAGGLRKRSLVVGCIRRRKPSTIDEKYTTPTPEALGQGVLADPLVDGFEEHFDQRNEQAYLTICRCRCSRRTQSMLQASNDAIINRALTITIAINYLCDERRQRFGRWICAFAMRVN